MNDDAPPLGTMVCPYCKGWYESCSLCHGQGVLAPADAARFRSMPPRPPPPMPPPGQIGDPITKARRCGVLNDGALKWRPFARLLEILGLAAPTPPPPRSTER